MGIFINAGLWGVGAGAAGAAAVWLFGARLGLIDEPNERSSHTVATPRGGGAGIPFGYALASLFSVLVYPFVYAGAAIGLLGLAEDRFSLSSRLRLFLQLLICASALAAFGGVPVSLAEAALFGVMLLFAAGTANFYNFMDGVNGMAGMTGAVAFASLAIYAMVFAGESATAAACVFIAFACAGFLPFNLPRARVFMGDAGSVFLGFEFAFMVIHFSTTEAEFLCVAMFLSLYYADCLLTLGQRGMEGRPLTKSHRSHLYQYLSNEIGVAHWKVSGIYAGAQLAVSVLSLAAYSKGFAWQVALFIGVSLFALFAYRSIRVFRPSGTRHEKGREAGAPS